MKGLRYGVTAAVVLAAAPARADEVADQIALIERQPSGMDRATWKERRREAARRLGTSGDRRAVPVLVEVVRTETFDIIGEIAIEALGKLGDPAAIPVLQAVVDDPSRDAAQRDRARVALERLGSAPEPRPPGEPADPADPPGPELPILGGGRAGEALPEGPSWGDQVLGAREELTFALGGASLAWDTVRNESTFDADVAAHYLRSLDRETQAWKVGADAALMAAQRNPDGRQRARLVGLVIDGHGEFRAYLNRSLYGIAFGTVRLEGTRLAYTDDDNPADDNSDRWIALDVQLALGAGWGRVLDVGTRLRVARIATALERARALGRPIDDGLARRLQAAWWGLRGELGTHRRLTATVRILRDAGVLLGEPDAGTTYELLRILEDPALDGRASGIDVHLGFAEGLLQRWRYPSDEEPGVDNGIDDGLFEQALLRARVARQLGETSDVAGELFARKRLLAPDDPPTPSPWAVAARARWRTFVYGDHFDPRGALDVGAELGLADDDLQVGDPAFDSDVGLRIGGEVGWTMILSRASSIRIAGAVVQDDGELFVGARLEAAYGLLDAGFARQLE